MKWTPEAKDHGSLRYSVMVKPQSGVGALAWLLQLLYGYNKITASYRRQNTPLKTGRMDIRCAIVAHFGHRLQTSECKSSPWGFK